MPSHANRGAAREGDSPFTSSPSPLVVPWCACGVQTCLLGCGPEGKQLALEAVSNILDLPPTPPPALPPLALSEAAARLALEKQPLLDAQAAVSMRRIVQAAVRRSQIPTAPGCGVCQGACCSCVNETDGLWQLAKILGIPVSWESYVWVLGGHVWVLPENPFPCPVMF